MPPAEPLAAPAARSAPPRRYRRREPEHTALYAALQHHLETFLAEIRAHDTTLPRFVERELRAFLRCGILAHGFARVHCPSCRHDRLVAFSCKGRGFCPSCLGKRMTHLAEHLVDHVLPQVPVRQWVLTVPPRLRYLIAYDPSLCSQVLRIHARALLTSYRRRAKTRGLTAPRTGALTFIQRFGSAANLNVHFHTQALDGVFTESPSGQLTFHPLPEPTPHELQDVVEEITCRTERLLKRRGLVREDAADAESADSPLLAACYAGSITQRAALGPRAGKKPPRLGAHLDVPFVEHRKNCHAQLDGFDLHAAVRVPAHARDRLEQLLRYAARPPLSHDRLTPHGDGRLRLTLKTPWHDGTTHVLLTPHELIERLIALVPRPHKNLLVYHGVLAPNARWRARVTAYARDPTPAERHHAPHGRGAGTGSTTPRVPSLRRRNPDWARLMQRAFQIDVLECPRCGDRMRLLALIQSPETARRILRHLGQRDHAPPITKARVSDLDHVA